MKTALVTGAYGFIGRHAACLFGSRGFHVVGIGHGTWSIDEWRKWNIREWHTCDVNLETLSTYAGRPDVIVHCAGSGSVAFSMSRPLEDFRRTVETSAHVLEFARLHAPEARIVLPSSAAVYGAAERMPISENAELNPASPYGVHKRLSEEIFRSYGRHFGVASSIVRLFSAYGEGLRKQLLWDCCRKLSDGDTGFFGTGNETRDLIHVEDAAELIFSASEHASSACPAVNGGSGSGVKTADILGVIFDVFGRSDAPVFSGEVRPGDPMHYEADISSALSWGWKPKIGWKEGVSAYAEWYLRNSV